MKNLTKILRVTLLSGSIILSLPAIAQRQARGGEHRGSQNSSTSVRKETPARVSSSPSMNRSSSSARVERSSVSNTRPGGFTRPNTSTTTTRPNSGNTTRPSTSTTTTRPGSSTTTRPNNSVTTRPSTSTTTTRPGNVTTRPGNNGTVNNRPNDNNRPGSNMGNNNRPNGNHPGGVVNNRPNGNHPGGNISHGSSVGRPGGFIPAQRPHYSYRNPGYRPPRPGGGYWSAPVFSNYHYGYWVPPRPVYPGYWRPGIPTLGTILGLTFGSFIDAGINSLYNAGYSVAGYIDNAIYLNNVRQLGYLWPEVIVNYNDGLMTGTQFNYWTQRADPNRYNLVYRQLVTTYGSPVEDAIVNGMRVATWWAGEGTGYITLQYGLAPSTAGINSYYTTLSYNAIY